MLNYSRLIAEVPAVCNRCRSFFPSGYGFDAGGTGVEVSLDIPSSAPLSRRCPACGGTGRVLGGVYSIVEDAISLLRGSERTVSELERLAGILHSAKERGASVEEVRSTVRKDLPELSSLADLLPRTRGELYAFIAMVIAAIALILQARDNGNAPDINVQQVTNNIIVQASAPPTQSGATPSAESANPTPGNATLGRKVGRNEPCPCESELKFKKCHGAGGETRYVGP